METTFHSDVNSINLQMMYINIIFRRLLRVKSYSPFFLLTLGIAVCSIKLFAYNMKLNILNWFWLKLMQYFVIIMHKANTIIYLVANLGSLYNNSETFSRSLNCATGSIGSNYFWRTDRQRQRPSWCQVCLRAQVS